MCDLISVSFDMHRIELDFGSVNRPRKSRELHDDAAGPLNNPMLHRSHGRGPDRRPSRPRRRHERPILAQSGIGLRLLLIASAINQGRQCQ
jgi:hypothetical protein